MGRKHGFRGTPVRPPKSPGTSGRVFEQKGDVYNFREHELRNKFGRNLDTENPDFDRYFAEERANQTRQDRLVSGLLKPNQVTTGESFRKSLTSRPTVADKVAEIRKRGQHRLVKLAYDARQRIVNIPEPHHDEPVEPDNVPAVVLGHDDSPSRQKQTPINAPKRSYYRFTKTDAPLPDLKKRKKRKRK